jgi:pilin isopeptide linkage protein
MKKMSKIFATLLTVATVCTMTAATVFADDPTPAANDAGTTKVESLTFTKKFESTNGGILPDETFTFTMTPDTTVDGTGKTADGLTIKQGIALTTSTVTLDFGADHDAEQTGTFSFADKTFEGPAVYRYKVQEVAPTGDDVNTAITYSTDVYTVDIMVDNTNTPIAVLNVGTDGSSTTEKKPITFTNTCATDKLVITKTVTGTMGDKTKQFDFSIDIPVAGDNIDLASGQKIPYTITRNNGTTETDKYFTVGGKNEFTLANGEKLEINDVPEGMIYTVTEASYATDGYDTSIVGTFSTGNSTVTKTLNKTSVYDATEKGQNTPIVNGGNTIAFTNHKDITNTGVAMNVAPYIAVLLVAIAGAIVLFVSKKRNIER